VTDDPQDERADEARSAVERLVDRRVEDAEGVGRPLSRRSMQRRRSVEDYLMAGAPPRWMERLGQIDHGITRERRRLERVHRLLREECGEDAAAFAQRWRAVAESWDFAELNELIRQHNDWYPIERNLPVNPRTRDYVTVGGQSYRRPVLGPAWVLEQFPAGG
jgi:hypothetical protein